MITAPDRTDPWRSAAKANRLLFGWKECSQRFRTTLCILAVLLVYSHATEGNRKALSIPAYGRANVMSQEVSKIFGFFLNKILTIRSDRFADDLEFYLEFNAHHGDSPL